jgi:hypothetical protein
MQAQTTGKASAYSRTSLSQPILLSWNILVRVELTHLQCLLVMRTSVQVFSLPLFLESCLPLAQLTASSDIKKIVIIDLDVHQGNGK